MKNTTENKEKYFAAHWGQEVLMHKGLRSCASVNSSWISERVDSSWLELTPLAEITEEDVKIVCDILGVENNKSWVINSFTYSMWSHSTLNVVDAIDYLRSCTTPYAIKYNGLSVEELIERGWLKLKSK